MRGRGLVIEFQVKKIFLYTGSVVTVSASLSFIAVSRLNARPQSLGPTSKLFFSEVLSFTYLIKPKSGLGVFKNRNRTEFFETETVTALKNKSDAMHTAGRVHT